MKVNQSDEEYSRYVESITPKHNCFKNCVNAFIIGGSICTLGQLIYDICRKYFDKSNVDAMAFTTIILILISVLFTALNIYKPLAKFGGAGALVPVTGFANSIASPTIEYKKEGEVFGKGVKVFTIAGPVILFGIITSFLLGLIYYLSVTFNIF